MSWNKNIYRALFFIWAVVLLVLSFYTPKGLNLNPDLPWPDKYKHVVGAFVLALLFHKAFPHFNFWYTLLIWAVFTTGFEAIQQIISHGQRQFDWLDIAANILGFMVGIPLIIGVKRLPRLIKR